MRNWIVAALVVAVLVMGGGELINHEVVQPVAHEVGLAADSHAIALEYCKNPATKLYLVESTGGSHYEAVYDSTSVRYDFTWQVGGTTVAVERTEGRTFDAWAEQIDTDFWECVSGRNAEIITKVVVH